MRRVDRSKVAAPAALGARRKRDATTELERATAHYGNPANTGSFTFKVYGDDSVKAAIHELFHFKCAYCESFYGHLHPVDVEHYRPKSAVEGVPGHRGYWWLAMDWENLLPSCIDCNRRREQEVPAAGALVDLLATGKFSRERKIFSGKHTAFPLSGGNRASWPASAIGQEQRLLLDPTRDNPDDHIVFHVDRGRPVALVLPKSTAGHNDQLLDMEMTDDALAAASVASRVSPMGAVSIKIYGLNRVKLVQARTRHLRDMEFLTDMATGLLELAFELDARIDAAGPAGSGPGYDLDRKVARRLRAFAGSIKTRLVELTAPSAPYSKLAQTWIEAYLAGP